MPRPRSFQPSEALSQMMMVFWQRGYEATSVSDLEQATGLNKRSLYNTFGNKEAIFQAVLELYLQMMGSKSAPLMQEPKGVENVRAFFRGLEYEPDMLGCLLTKTVNEQDVVPKNGSSMAKGAILHTEQLFYENLLAASGKKAVARRLAAFLTNSVQGITTMAKVDPDPKRLRAVVRCILATVDAEIEESG